MLSTYSLDSPLSKSLSFFATRLFVDDFTARAARYRRGGAFPGSGFGAGGSNTPNPGVDESIRADLSYSQTPLYISNVSKTKYGHTCLGFILFCIGVFARNSNSLRDMGGGGVTRPPSESVKTFERTSLINTHFLNISQINRLNFHCVSNTVLSWVGALEIQILSYYFWQNVSVVDDGGVVFISKQFLCFVDLKYGFKLSKNKENTLKNYDYNYLT